MIGADASAGDEFVPHFVSVVVTSGMGGRVDGVRERLPAGGSIERGGAARLATLLRFMRREGDVVYIDTGGLTGESDGERQPDRAMRAFKALGCAAIVLGEKDSPTHSVGRESPVPILSVDPTAPTEADGFRVLRSVRVTADGIPIAIIGGGHLADSAPPAKLEALATAIVQESGRVRKSYAPPGVGLVIVAVHAAGTCSRLTRINDFSHFRQEDCDPSSPLLALTHKLATISKSVAESSVDLVVGGHGAESGVAAVVDGIPVVAATADGTTFAEVGLKAPRDRGAHSNWPMDYSLVPPEQICSRIVPGGGPCGVDSFAPQPLKADAAVLKLLGRP